MTKLICFLLSDVPCCPSRQLLGWFRWERGRGVGWLAGVPGHFVTEVAVGRFVVSGKEEVEHGVHNRVAGRIGLEVALSYVGHLVLPVHQYVIPWLVLVRLGLVGLVPAVVRLAGGVEVHD